MKSKMNMAFSSPLSCQFHQNLCELFADILAPKNFKPKLQLCNFWHQNISAKWARKMLMKSTPTYVIRYNNRIFKNLSYRKQVLNEP